MDSGEISGQSYTRSSNIEQVDAADISWDTASVTFAFIDVNEHGRRQRARTRAIIHSTGLLLGGYGAGLVVGASLPVALVALALAIIAAIAVWLT